MWLTLKYFPLLVLYGVLFPGQEYSYSIVSMHTLNDAARSLLKSTLTNEGVLKPQDPRSNQEPREVVLVYNMTLTNKK